MGRDFVPECTESKGVTSPTQVLYIHKYIQIHNKVHTHTQVAHLTRAKGPCYYALNGSDGKHTELNVDPVMCVFMHAFWRNLLAKGGHAEISHDHVSLPVNSLTQCGNTRPRTRNASATSTRFWNIVCPSS